MAQAVVRRRVEMEAGCWDLVISDFRGRKPRSWRSAEEPMPRPAHLTVESAHQYFFSLASVRSLLRKSVAATGDPDERKAEFTGNPDLGMPHASLKRGSVSSGLSSWPQWLDALATRGKGGGKEKPIPASVLRAYRRAVEQRVQQALFPAGKLRRLLPPTPYQPPLCPTLHRVVDTPNMLVHLGRFLDLASLCRLRAVSRGVRESLTGEPHLWEDVRFPASRRPLEWRFVGPVIDRAAGRLKVRTWLIKQEFYLSSWGPFGSDTGAFTGP
jgi:hypothetical protein